MCKNKKKYRCPCCGCYTLDTEPGHFDICDVCGWEDDNLQRIDLNLTGGANTMSLNQARANYKRLGAVDEKALKHVRPPKDSEIPE